MRILDRIDDRESTESREIRSLFAEQTGHRDREKTTRSMTGTCREARPCGIIFNYDRLYLRREFKGGSELRSAALAPL